MNNSFFKSFQSGPRNLFFIALLMVGALFTVLQLTEYSRSIQTLPYSAFLTYVERNEVRSVKVSGQKVNGVLKDNKTQFETIVPENDPHQWDLLRAHNIDVSISEPSTSSLNWLWVFIMGGLILGFIILFLIRQTRNNSSSGSTLFSLGKSRAKMFLPSQVKVTFADVAGAKDAKEELSDIVAFLKNPDRFRRLGGKLPKGILLVGEPGNGKTLMARALAGEANCPFFSVSGSDFVEVYVGVGAARIRDLFAQARRHAPCIVFIDEIDAIGRQRGTGLGGGSDEREQTLNQLLTEMDGFDSYQVPVIVVAATNLVDVLDKALLRPGRFDRAINIPYPDLEARKEIIQIHTRTLKLSPDVDIQKLAEDTAGFTAADLANLINQAALLASKHNHNAILPEDIEEARNKTFKSQDVHNATGALQSRDAAKVKLFMPTQVKTRFNDVAGAWEAKEELKDVVEFLQNPQKFKRLGARIPRGVLLVGEPGNGKTLLARAVAGEAGRPFFVASGSDFVEIYVGMGASRVRELFAQARKHAPCIVFIDEIDALGGARSDFHNSERDQTLNQLLSELDGFDSRQSDVIIIGATNRADLLDKALLRPGRFDRQVVVPYPDLAAREEILKVHIKNVVIDPTIDLKKIARASVGFSGADLAHLINEAALAASKRNAEQVMLADLEEARDKIIMGKEARHKNLTPEELKMTAYHEAGHALVRLLLPESTDPLYKVTIVPRGMSLGATHWLPERDKYSTNKEEMLASITSALGGRVAEELMFNSISSGASSDFKVATDLARTMICSYGMSDALGAVYYKQTGYDQKWSEDTSRRIDEEIRTIIGQCYNKAKEILVNNKDKLEVLAQLLLEKETMSAQEIYEALGITPRVDVSLQS